MEGKKGTPVSTQLLPERWFSLELQDLFIEITQQIDQQLSWHMFALSETLAHLRGSAGWWYMHAPVYLFSMPKSRCQIGTRSSTKLKKSLARTAVRAWRCFIKGVLYNKLTYPRCRSADNPCQRHTHTHTHTELNETSLDLVVPTTRAPITQLQTDPLRHYNNNKLQAQQHPQAQRCLLRVQKCNARKTEIKKGTTYIFLAQLKYFILS